MLYLRTIEMFSWLIRMITECIVDMKAFLLVLFIGVIAFADAFKSIEKALVLEGRMEVQGILYQDDWYSMYLAPYIRYW